MNQSNYQQDTFEEKERQRVLAIPEELRKELLYLAHLDPKEQKSTLLHNVAVSGERIQRDEAQAQIELLERVKNGLMREGLPIPAWRVIEAELSKLRGGEDA